MLHYHSLLGQIICEDFELAVSDIATITNTYSMASTPLNSCRRISRYHLLIGLKLMRLPWCAICVAPGAEEPPFIDAEGRDMSTSTRSGWAVRHRLQKELRDMGVPQPPSYINGDTGSFERIESIGAKFNRCLIYRCSNLHSGDIPPDYAFDTNPRTGRFTLTSFLHGQ